MGSISYFGTFKNEIYKKIKKNISREIIIINIPVYYMIKLFVIIILIAFQTI